MKHLYTDVSSKDKERRWEYYQDFANLEILLSLGLISFQKKNVYQARLYFSKLQNIRGL